LPRLRETAARYPDDSLANVVLAHHGRNNDKRHYLAAADHLTRRGCAMPQWSSTGPTNRSGHCRWHGPCTLHLPQSARLWQARGTFAPIDTAVVPKALLGA
jgi:hypothetical protein